MMTIVSAPRFLLKLALAPVFVLGPLRCCAAEGDWDKHMKAGEKALQSNKSGKAEEEFRAALAQTETFPASDPRTAETLGKLAELYTGESKFAEANDLLKREAGVIEAAAGPDDPRLAYVLISLALDYEREDKPDEAAPLWGRSVAILEKAARPVDPGVVMNMRGVAVHLRMQGSNNTGEEQIYSAILELSESLGASDQDLRIALWDMAFVSQRADRYAPAEPLVSRVLKMDERNHGPESSMVASDLRQFADLYTSEGKYEAALPLLQRRLEIAEKINRPDPPSVRRRKNLETAVDVTVLIPQLPLILLTEGSVGYMPFDSARRPDQAEVFDCYKELAKGYANAGKYAASEGMYQQIIEADDKAVDGKKAKPDRSLESTILFDDLIDFARVYRRDRRFHDALETIRRSQPIAQEIADSKRAQQNVQRHGPSIYPWISEIELAETYRAMGDPTEAASAFEQSLRMAEDLKVLPGNPKLAVMLDNDATLLRDQGKYGQSEALYLRSLDAWEKSRRPGNPEIAGTLMRYAALLRKVDRPAEADALEARASGIQLKSGAAVPVD